MTIPLEDEADPFASWRENSKSNPPPANYRRSEIPFPPPKRPPPTEEEMRSVMLHVSYH